MLQNPKSRCRFWFDLQVIMHMLVDVGESLWSNPLIWNWQHTHLFEMAHLQIDVFRADGFLTRFASGFEFKIGNVVRNLMTRTVCPMIAIQLTLLL